MPVIETDQLVGMPRVAALLGVAAATANLHAAQGRFKTVRIDGRLFARTDDVLRYRAEREQQLNNRSEQRA